MLVEMKSASLHVRLADLFGTPTPTAKDDYEIFGPYEVDGKTLYWCYDIVFATWSVVEGADLPLEVRTGEGIPTQEVRQAEDAIESIRFIPVPKYPERPETHVDTMWFSHGGWPFAWHMDCERELWELRLLRRR